MVRFFAGGRKQCRVILIPVQRGKEQATIFESNTTTLPGGGVGRSSDRFNWFLWFGYFLLLKLDCIFFQVRIQRTFYWHKVRCIHT